MFKNNEEAFTPELVFYVGSALLEGPVWDEKNQVLYCVSIEDGIIYRFNPKTTRTDSYQTDGSVGCAVLKEDGMLLSAEKTGIYQINPETNERTFLAQPNEDSRMRYNDGKLDPRGRFLVGTMGEEKVIDKEAVLFSIEGKNSKTILSGLSISNGLGWSPDGSKMYFIDSPTKKVNQYYYNLKTGEVCFEKAIVEIKDDSIPDGMCVDLDGMIWVAEYGGSKVCRWNPETGEKLAEILMPVKNVTSCCIGGKELDQVFITTAKDDENELSGGLFKVKIR